MFRLFKLTLISVFLFIVTVIFLLWAMNSESRGVNMLGEAVLWFIILVPLLGLFYLLIRSLMQSREEGRLFKDILYILVGIIPFGRTLFRALDKTEVSQEASSNALGESGRVERT